MHLCLSIFGVRFETIETRLVFFVSTYFRIRHVGWWRQVEGSSHRTTHCHVRKMSYLCTAIQERRPPHDLHPTIARSVLVRIRTTHGAAQAPHEQ